MVFCRLGPLGQGPGDQAQKCRGLKDLEEELG